MFNKIPKEKYERYEMMFEAFVSENDDLLANIVSPKLLSLYRNKNGNYERSQLLMDALDYHETKNFNRVLYLLSLIEKYIRPLENCSVMKMISRDRKTIDTEMVVDLLSTPLPLDIRIIHKDIKLLNSFRNPVRMADIIIRKYLPTRYRFLAPTYYKQILSSRPS